MCVCVCPELQLILTGEVNAQQSMSHTANEGPGGTSGALVGHGTASCRLLVLSQEC